MEVSAFSNLAQPADALMEQGVIELDQLKQIGEATPEETGQRFEELFTTMLVKEFRKTLSEGFFGAGPGADTYDSWLDEHLGKALADQDTLGIAGLVKAHAKPAAVPQEVTPEWIGAEPAEPQAQTSVPVAPTRAEEDSE